MVVEFVSLMASTKRFWFVVILQVISHGILIKQQDKYFEEQYVRGVSLQYLGTYPKSAHKNNPATTFIVNGGRFFL
jgi:hypothetical protein